MFFHAGGTIVDKEAREHLLHGLIKLLENMQLSYEQSGAEFMILATAITNKAKTIALSGISQRRCQAKDPSRAYAVSLAFST